MPPRPTWRPLQPTDIPALMRVADTVHPSLPESASIFAERAALFPEGCLVLVNKPWMIPFADQPTPPEEIIGYAISHPIPPNQPPKLDTLLGSVPTDVENSQFYIHDVAVLGVYRGKGLAREGVNWLLGVAERKGYEMSCLVSVYGTETFWGRFGFEKPKEVDEALEEKVRGYGDDAVFLVRRNDE